MTKPNYLNSTEGKQAVHCAASPSFIGRLGSDRAWEGPAR